MRSQRRSIFSLAGDCLNFTVSPSSYLAERRIRFPSPASYISLVLLLISSGPKGFVSPPTRNESSPRLVCVVRVTHSSVRFSRELGARISCGHEWRKLVEDRRIERKKLYIYALRAEYLRYWILKKEKDFNAIFHAYNDFNKGKSRWHQDIPPREFHKRGRKWIW